MKRKIVIVAVVLWAGSLLGGALWGRIQRELETRRFPPGVREVEKLKDLYAAGLFDEVLAECDRAESDNRNASVMPQIFYVRWATDRRTGRTEASDVVERSFLNRFPNDPLAANMHFATAMNLLAQGNYVGAERELSFIENHYETSALLPQAQTILAQLRKYAAMSDEPGVSEVSVSSEHEARK